MSEARDMAKPLAGRWRRLFATLIDLVLVPALTILLVMMTGVMEDPEDYRNSAFVLPVFALAISSYLLLNGYWLFMRGQTVGKRLLSVAIVDHSSVDHSSVDHSSVDHSSGARAHFWKLIVIRTLFFPFLYLTITPALIALVPLIDQFAIFTKQRRCVHDYAAGTRVVKV